MMRKWFYGLVLLALLLVPASPAYAQGGPHDGRVIIGQDFTLKSAETLNGDLVVIGGQVDIQQAAVVRGNVVVIGGSLQLDGQSTGDTVVIGGVVNMGAKAAVSGDLVTVGGALQRAEGATVGGNVVTNLPPPQIHLPVPVTPQAAMPPVPPTPNFTFNWGPFGTAAGILMQAIGLAALAMLLTLFLHPQLDRVSQALTRQPLMSGSIGLLTVLLAPIALVLLVITIILIPVALAGVILVVLAWLFGVVAIGMEVGDRFSRAVHVTWEPVLTTGAGTFLLGLGVGIVNLVPCVGWLAPVIVGLTALGAALITRFGTQPVNIATPAAPIPPAPADASGTENALPPAS
jgi:hypothetical protein